MRLIRPIVGITGLGLVAVAAYVFWPTISETIRPGDRAKAPTSTRTSTDTATPSERNLEPARSTEEARGLAAIGFDQPVAVSGYVDAVFPEPAGRHRYSDRDIQLAALFAKTGYLKILPNDRAAPWFQVVAPSGGIGPGWTSDRYSVPVGKRVIVGRTDRREWSENGSQFIAETISYAVELNSELASLAVRTRGPSSLRLVMVNDPAVGQWQVSDQSSFDAIRADQEVAASELAPAGKHHIASTRRQVEAAILKAYDMIEGDLSARGAIARAPSYPDVLVSRALKLSYFKKSPNFAHYGGDTAFGTFNRFNLGAVLSYCANLEAGGKGNWRLPTFEEMDAIISINSSLKKADTGTVFLDTPDGRLWGDLQQTSSSMVEYVTGSIIANRTLFRVSDLSASSSRPKLPSPQIVTVQVGKNGIGGGPSGQYLGGQYDSGLPFERMEIDTLAVTRVVCVSDLV